QRRCNCAGLSAHRPEATLDKHMELLKRATAMSDTNDEGLSPAERVHDIPRITRALKQAVKEALWQHKLAGNPVAIWKDGRVVWVQPEDIPGPEDPPWAD